jgi:hypothetical protein
MNTSTSLPEKLQLERVKGKPGALKLLPQQDPQKGKTNFGNIVGSLTLH